MDPQDDHSERAYIRSASVGGDGDLGRRETGERKRGQGRGQREHFVVRISETRAPCKRLASRSSKGERPEKQRSRLHEAAAYVTASNRPVSDVGALNASGAEVGIRD